MRMHFDKLMNEQRFNAIIQMNKVLSLTTMGLIALLIISLTANVVLTLYVKAKGQPQYFATTTDGRLYALQALNEPILSQTSVSSWAARYILQTFSFNYTNIDDVMAQVRPAYTDDAFNSLSNNLNDSSGLIAEIQKNRYLMSATLLSTPRLVSQGIDSATGRYQWQYVYPVLLTFKNESATLSARFDITASIVRVDQRNNPFGLAIDNIIAKEVKANAA